MQDNPPEIIDGTEIGKAHKIFKEIAQRLTETIPQLAQDYIVKHPNGKLEDGTSSAMKEKEMKDEFKDLAELQKEKVILSPSDLAQKNKALEKYIKERVAQRDSLEKEMVEKQKRYIKREQEFRDSIEKKQAFIQTTSNISNPVAKTKLEGCKQQQKDLIQKISECQRRTADLLMQQEKGIVGVFNQKLSAVKKEIEEERLKKSNKTKDMKAKNMELNDHMEILTSVGQKIDMENRKLTKQNQELSVQYKAQDNDKTLLTRQILIEKQRSETLKEQIDTYQKALEENYKQDEKEIEKEEMKIESEKVDTEEDKQRMEQYEKMVEQLRKLIRIENDNLRRVKTMYSREIASKFELQKFLRQCIDDVKNEISKKKSENRVLSHSLKSAQAIDEVGLTMEDREKIIEVLLSQERVLTLLYDKTFPPKIQPPLKAENVTIGTAQ